MDVIKLENVWKIYRMGDSDINALRELNLNIKEGEFLAVIGPSGSGKSTLMHMIGCLDVPTKGKVYLDGRDISKLEESDLAHIRGKRIGFIFQTFNLIPSLNALENVILPMTFQGVDRERKIRKAKRLLELVDLNDRIGHKPSELSGGEQQRVAIARALANDPEVILADEPTGNLDTKTGDIIIKFLKKLHKEESKTIVIVTHDLDVARECRKVARLIDGSITSFIPDGALKR